MLLWLWHRPETAALIQPLAQELTYAAGAALKKERKKKKKPRRYSRILPWLFLSGGIMPEPISFFMLFYIFQTFHNKYTYILLTIFF